MCRKLGISKADVAELLDRFYIKGTKSLEQIARFCGCSTVRVKQIGKEMVPGYTEAAKLRMKDGPKNRLTKCNRVA